MIEIGKKYNKLTVLKVSDYRSPNSRGKYYECKCDCGNISRVRGSGLIAKTRPIKSCGCIKKTEEKYGKHKVKPGDVFGRLTVIDYAEKRPKTRSLYYICKCVCGTVKDVNGRLLLRGESTSCGCYHREISTIHGMSRSKEYKARRSMIDRCYNKNGESYKDYGERGIKVCDEWLDSFEKFYEDMGAAPSNKYSIDRIDVNGNYEPSNVRWALPTRQTRNRRNTFYATYNGEKRSVADWAEHFGIPYWKLYNVLKTGVTMNELFGKPTIINANDVLEYDDISRNNIFDSNEYHEPAYLEAYNYKNCFIDESFTFNDIL